MSIYLTDKQYLELLQKLRIDLDKTEKILFEDSTETGYKHTVTNVGLCAGEATETNWSKDKHLTRETAMWPKEFDKIGKVKYESPQMFTRKYKRKNHKCPFAEKGTNTDGCFYRCKIFQKKYKIPSIEEAKQMYDKCIDEVKNKLGL